MKINKRRMTVIAAGVGALGAITALGLGGPELSRRRSYGVGVSVGVGVPVGVPVGVSVGGGGGGGS